MHMYISIIYCISACFKKIFVSLIKQGKQGKDLWLEYKDKLIISTAKADLEKHSTSLQQALNL